MKVVLKCYNLFHTFARGWVVNHGNSFRRFHAVATFFSFSTVLFCWRMASGELDSSDPDFRLINKKLEAKPAVTSNARVRARYEIVGFERVRMMRFLYGSVLRYFHEMNMYNVLLYFIVSISFNKYTKESYKYLKVFF